MLRYVLFDLDGTLTESGPGIINGVRSALRACGVDPIREEELPLFIGPPLTDSFARFYGMDESEAERALTAYREYYNDKGVFENSPYPGIYDMLNALHDTHLHLAISSSKPENMVHVVLEHFKLGAYFEEVVCGTDSGPLYTKAGVIAETLRRFAERDGRTREEICAAAVMVGDRKHDIEGAKENGLRTIGVRWGYAPEGELEEAGADRIVGSAEELTALLRYPEEETKQTSA